METKNRRSFNVYCRRCTQFLGQQNKGLLKEEIHLSVICVGRFLVLNTKEEGKSQGGIQIKKLYPHNRECMTSGFLRSNYQTDPRQGGSGVVIMKMPYDTLFSTTYDQLAIALDSYQQGQLPPGTPINNGWDNYPYDDRRYVDLPILENNELTGAVHPEMHRASMTRYILWHLNTFNLVFEFYSELDLAEAFFQPNTMDHQEGLIRPPHLHFKKFVCFFSGHGINRYKDSRGKVVWKYAIPQDIVHQPSHTDFVMTEVDGQDVTCFYNKLLEGRCLPFTNVIPIHDYRTIAIKTDKHFQEIGRGSVLNMAGCVEHFGQAYHCKPKTKMFYHPAIHHHGSSLHHEYVANQVMYTPRPDTYMPVEHI